MNAISPAAGGGGTISSGASGGPMVAAGAGAGAAGSAVGSSARGPAGSMATASSGHSGGMPGMSAAGRSSAPPVAGTPAAGMSAAGMPAVAAGSGAAPAGPAAPSSGCGAMAEAPNGSQTIDVDGTQREYIVKVPSDYDRNKPYRLVFAWHGLGGTAMQIASNFYGLVSRSANSAIFISPQGLPNPQQNNLAAWNNTGDGDVKFTRQMIDWAKAMYCIDEKRIFSIGMSNGGMFANVVGCELGDTFRATAAMSGGGPQGYAAKACTGKLAVWISHGNKDNNVPFSYGQKSRDYWVKANHCGSETVTVMPGNCLEYQGCDEGYPVQFCEFDGGHMVPSFAGEATWNFFSRF